MSPPSSVREATTVTPSAWATAWPSEPRSPFQTSLLRTSVLMNDHRPCFCRTCASRPRQAARRCRTPVEAVRPDRNRDRAPRRSPGSPRSASKARSRLHLGPGRRRRAPAAAARPGSGGPSPARSRSGRSRPAGTGGRCRSSGMPRRRPTSALRPSRGSPTCQSPVPALSITIWSLQARLARPGGASPPRPWASGRCCPGRRSSGERRRLGRWRPRRHSTTRPNSVAALAWSMPRRPARPAHTLSAAGTITER